MKKNDRWYAKGLRFSCTECGKCCTGSPGYVWVNRSEMEEMARFLDIPLNTFKKLYTRRVGNRYSLLESKETYDCIFLKDKKCRLYGARPTQCKTFPWWPQNLNSQEAWEATAQTCEGIDDKANLVDYETIEQQKLIQIGRNEENS
ncbi:MAG: YkgJ family cysteine cluster protein [Chlamydiales bacterium]|nr:YkgJ family cysteine cluster protein [Chlamydiales bacterium]